MALLALSMDVPSLTLLKTRGSVSAILWINPDSLPCLELQQPGNWISSAGSGRGSEEELRRRGREVGSGFQGHLLQQLL